MPRQPIPPGSNTMTGTMQTIARTQMATVATTLPKLEIEATTPASLPPALLPRLRAEATPPHRTATEPKLPQIPKALLETISSMRQQLPAARRTAEADSRTPMRTNKPPTRARQITLRRTTRACKGQPMAMEELRQLMLPREGTTSRIIRRRATIPSKPLQSDTIFSVSYNFTCKKYLMTLPKELPFCNTTNHYN